MIKMRKRGLIFFGIFLFILVVLSLEVSGRDPCYLNLAEITAGCDPCGVNDIITMTGYTKPSYACDYSFFFQINATDHPTAGVCNIRFEGGTIRGIWDEDASGTWNSITGAWTIPSVPDECKGKTVYAMDAFLYDTFPPREGDAGTNSNAIGSFTFEGSPQPHEEECNDDIDNDGDRYIDYDFRGYPYGDPGCLSVEDDEFGETECDDDIDNDGDSAPDCGDSGCWRGDPTVCDPLWDDETTCGDGVCEGGETPDSCPDDCAPTCDLTSASWSSTNVVEGTQVQLIVGGTNCNGKTITLNIYEKDSSTRDFVESLSGTFSGTQATATWTAVWMDDDHPNQDDPEYEFDAIYSGGIISGSGSGDTITSGLLIVRKSGGPGGIEFCRDYSEEVKCSADEDGVAGKLVPSGITCDDINYHCFCEWIAGRTPFPCYDAYNAFSNSGSNIGTCSYNGDSDDTCSDDGFLSYSWTASWTWDENNNYDEQDCQFFCGQVGCVEDPEESGSWHCDPNNAHSQCTPGENTVPCVSQEGLPFFGIYNFIVAVLVVALIYFLMNLKKRRSKMNKKV